MTSRLLLKYRKGVKKLSEEEAAKVVAEAMMYENCYFCDSPHTHKYRIARATLQLCPLHERVLAKYIVSEVFKYECLQSEVNQMNG